MNVCLFHLWKLTRIFQTYHLQWRVWFHEWYEEEKHVFKFWLFMNAIFTLFEIFIFCVQKFNFDFPRKLSIFSGWKTRENVVVLDCLALDNFDFTRKIVKKNWMKNSWNWIFGQKFDFSNSVPMISSVLIDALCLYWTLEIKKYCNTILKLLEFYATHFVCSRSISKMRSGIT